MILNWFKNQCLLILQHKKLIFFRNPQATKIIENLQNFFPKQNFSKILFQHPNLFLQLFVSLFKKYIKAKIFNKFTLNASLNLADMMLYKNGLMHVETKNKTPDTVFTLNETFSLNALCSMYVNKSRWMWNGNQHKKNVMTTTTEK
jgi:hypothetical protein